MELIIEKYFPLLSPVQKERFESLKSLYEDWNSRINVISRKDLDNFWIHHVLHSLAIARVVSFTGKTKVLDVGTGGGFPGIPLSILFPDTEFTLLDSIQKKIKVVTGVARSLKLDNVIPLRARAEENRLTYDFVVARAVTSFSEFVKLTSHNVRRGNDTPPGNGIICLKGGDLSEELSGFRDRVKVWDIKDFFEEPFFETKQIVYLPL